MLPPVPKIPAADATYGAMVPPAPRGQPKEAAVPQTVNPAPDHNGSIFARAAVASLTSEFQLSRGTAVLAETLGKLMNLPRRDGEAIETYVVRLTDALRAMPAAQRLALEQQVGKALQGLSLAMLAEILKQPTGPEAARLALLIELSRYKGTDLAAKAVVSSYQQNNPASPAPAQPRPQNAQNQNATSQPNATATAAAQPANATTANRLLPLLISPLALGGAAIKSVIAARVPLPDLPANLPAPAAGKPGSSPQTTRPDGKAEGTAPQPQPAAGSVAKDVPAEARPVNSSRVENSDMRTTLPHREMMKAEQKETRAVLTSPSGQPAGDAKTVENLLLATLAGKLPARAATGAQPFAAPEAIPPQQTELRPAEKTPMATPAPASGEETEATAARPEPLPLPRTAADPETRMAMLEQSASQSLAAAALVKDGTPLPLVAYPPADEDYESETPPRGGGPFSEDEAESEAEGENAESPEEAEERMEADGEPGEPETLLHMAADDDNAENYYLKMSGMP
ncbi:hypothetical protein [Rhizobium sp. UGM030330-04]|uniref:hypothetical protein n=1 Tax=Rhizobium sp. UGM030330-04 TaxID=1378077 RepID=UPI000D9BE44D|nr:hypothetical protein [Rhizobium sp. UGM030330-04]PYG57975.1 hypothetical protein N434_03034 [Rhizobium sp. UGM030330-04]